MNGADPKRKRALADELAEVADAHGPEIAAMVARMIETDDHDEPRGRRPQFDGRKTGHRRVRGVALTIGGSTGRTITRHRDPYESDDNR